ncbi:phosphatase PAP2 family protein [Alicyclobacillus dauci]|uniref:Phosphatase PAP2 family protein n=1 Tax=Alicyclobacillus dauci TaxID=1475485 RepID=A0ABY6Z6J3_9BACL|nr:phosphatase PAP2 family protein [Alicyclobacillus dauci]WAH38365.1 phosphatase PAP2 family protein [Alicyclobacillus dauci]
MDRFDLSLYHAINGLAGHNAVLDDIMRFFAQYALEIYGLLFIVAWFALPKPDLRNRHALVMAGLAGILALIINVIIAHIWYRSRPFVVLSHGSYQQLVPHSVDSSFPSDHASGSWAFAGGSWGRAPKWIQILFTAIAIVVMFARVYVGVHWPTDVLASVLVGAIAGQLIQLVSKFVYPITSWVAHLFRFGLPTSKVAGDNGTMNH